MNNNKRNTIPYDLLIFLAVFTTLTLFDHILFKVIPRFIF